jgi:DNA-binding Lrp family transcriptional regulator
MLLSRKAEAPRKKRAMTMSFSLVTNSALSMTAQTAHHHCKETYLTTQRVRRFFTVRTTSMRSRVILLFSDWEKQIEESDLEAYILVNAEYNAIWSVAEALLKMEGVKMAHTVTGQFDVVALIEFPKMEDLGNIIDKIQRLSGVRRTQTLITIPRPVRE